METTATLPEPPAAPDPLTPEQQSRRDRDAEIGKFNRLAYQASEQAAALRARSRELNRVAHHYRARAAELIRKWQNEAST